MLVSSHVAQAGSLGLLGEEEFKICYASAVSAGHEDTKYVRKKKLCASDILAYLKSPKTPISEEQKPMLKYAQDAIEDTTMIGGIGVVIAPWESISGAFLGSLINPLPGMPLDIDKLFALGFVRGLKPFQALYHRLVDEEDFSLKMSKLSL